MILITGATGFVGKNLVLEISKKKRVRILVRRTSDITPFEGREGIDIVYGDLDKNEGIIEALVGVEVVIHCAVRTIARNFIEYYRMNTLGTAHLVRAMIQGGIKNIVYLSSHAACGPCREKTSLTETDQTRPISSYGITKKLAEDIIINSGLLYTILRPVSVYGPYDTEILKYIKLLNRGICPIVGIGEKYINLIYVTDLVRLIINIVHAHNFSNKIFFISDGNCYSYSEVLDIIADTLHKKNVRVYVPEKIALFVGLLNDIFLPEKKRLIWRDKVRELAQKYWLCRNERAVIEFSFTPRYSLKEGMKETIDWYRQQGIIQ